MPRGERLARPLPRLTRLDADAFCELLQREKRRADRSHQPLCLIVYRRDAEAGAETDATDGPWAWLTTLDRARRDTDILGDIAPGVCALLCPSSGEAAAQRLGRLMGGIAGARTCRMAVATYPDARFEQLGAELAATAATAARVPLLAPLPGCAAAPGYRLKRGVDITGALLGLALLWPLMLTVAVLVRLTSPGPAIFKQERVGKGGRPFTFYKFRSMSTGASENPHRDFTASLIRQPSNQPQYKMTSDPRVTPLGRILRKTSIDELPQLFNVLRGDMSLVGPRPPIAYEAEHYQSWHLRRVLEIKPGITGLWQVQGRSRVSFDDMVRMDIQYLQRCSLSYDLAILLKTVKVVLRGEGAW